VRERSPYWFPAKRYGWGWGLPTAWQGWVALVIFAGLLGAGAVWFLPSHAPAFVLYTLLLCAALVVVCWLKGEPPAWHWGKK
jgi:hypothetical protein